MSYRSPDFPRREELTRRRVGTESRRFDRHCRQDCGAKEVEIWETQHGAAVTGRRSAGLVGPGYFRVSETRILKPAEF